jgi:hypothetical protein
VLRELPLPEAPPLDVPAPEAPAPELAPAPEGALPELWMPLLLFVLMLEPLCDEPEGSLMLRDGVELLLRPAAVVSVPWSLLQPPNKAAAPTIANSFFILVNLPR